MSFSLPVSIEWMKRFQPTEDGSREAGGGRPLALQCISRQMPRHLDPGLDRTVSKEISMCWHEGRRSGPDRVQDRQLSVEQTVGHNRSLISIIHYVRPKSGSQRGPPLNSSAR